MEQIQEQKTAMPQFFMKDISTKNIAKIEIKKLLNKNVRLSLLLSNHSSYPVDYQSNSQLSDFSPSQGTFVENPLDLDQLTLQLSDYQNLVDLLQYRLKIQCQQHSNEFDQGMKSVNAIVKAIQEMQEQIQSSRSGLQQFKRDIAANILRNNLLILKKRRIELI